MNMKLKAIFTCFLFLYSLSLAAQAEIWEKIENYEQKEVRKNLESQSVYPTAYTLLRINKSELKSLLKTSPQRQEKGDIQNLPVLDIPLPDGNTLNFYIEEASVMHPDLQSKFPNIKSFAGYGVDQKDAYLRFDYSHKGYHFQILSSQHGTIKIDPIKGQEDLYQCYFKKDIYVSDNSKKFECAFDDKLHTPDENTSSTASRFLQGDNDLREYRLAVACTGEYTNYHGGTVSDAVAAINTTITRVVGIYEREFSITMTLVGNNNNIIYTNAATDPFTNGNASMMIDENRSTLNSVIGSSNFDIGHLFGTSGAGLAYLNGPCGSNKARATSAIANPMGDFFDVDYVCHEMGHQFGANHTQYNSCNRNNSTAMEPGSGSTIMGYAGICVPNIQNNTDAYFHAVSIEEIEAFTTTGNGNNCPTKTDLGNSFPTVSAGSDYTIPKSTPFILTATGSDSDGDILTYNWEQMDNVGTQTQPPLSSNTEGPLFRSYDPTIDNKRYFPSLPLVISGNDSDWEVLSSVGRDINFRVTARDNKAGNGLTEEDDCIISVDGNSGPFLVTYPNTGIQWNTGESKTVTWNVANTNSAPVSCSHVDILLSIDGGYTYPTTLAANVTNDGSHTIVVPDLMSSFARVRIMCANNIFYDISDVNFGLNSPPFPEYCEVSYNNSSCNTGDFIDDVSFVGISNLSTSCATNGDNYSDFTNITSDVEVGNDYTLSVKPNPSYAQYFAAYIDWNLDGDFLDANEYFDIGHVAAGSTETMTISIDNGVSMGEKLLRVICRYGTNPLVASDGCGSGFNYGEVEDYIIMVAEPVVLDPCDGVDIIMTQNYNNGQVDLVKASNKVTATNVINSGADVQYSGAVQVDLNTGFEVKVGATFEAYIGPCQ